MDHLKDLNEFQLSSLAANPEASAAELRELATHSNEVIRALVITNPSTPAKVAATVLNELALFLIRDKMGALIAHYHIPKRVLVLAIGAKYPEAHEGMPHEWLLNLWEGLHTF